MRGKLDKTNYRRNGMDIIKWVLGILVAIWLIILEYVFKSYKNT